MGKSLKGRNKGEASCFALSGRNDGFGPNPGRCPGLICCGTFGAKYKCATSNLARRAQMFGIFRFTEP